MQWLSNRYRNLRGALRENEILLTLSLAQILVMLGVGMVSPVLPLYARTFDVSTALVGLMITSFGAARLMTSLPTGKLADRIGRRPLLLAGPLLTGTGAILAAVAPEFWTLVAARFIQGIGSAIYATAAMVSVADISRPESRGRVMSVFQGSLLIGVSIGPTVGGLAASLLGLSSVFYLYAFTSLIVFVVVYLRVQETHRPGDVQDRSAERRAEGSSRFSGDTLRLVSNLSFVAVAFVSISIFFSRTGGRQTIVPLLGSEELMMSALAIGMIMSIGSFFNVLALPFAGWSIDRLGRKHTIFPSMLISGAGFALFALAPNIVVFAAASAVVGIGTGIAGPAPAAYVTDLARGRSYGTTIGLFRTVSDFGFVSGPVLLGWIADTWDFSSSLYFCAGLLFVSGLFFQIFAREIVAPQTDLAPRVEPASASGDSG